MESCRGPTATVSTDGRSSRLLTDGQWAERPGWEWEQRDSDLNVRKNNCHWEVNEVLIHAAKRGYEIFVLGGFLTWPYKALNNLI